MRIVGITGGIGSGKTTVCRIFRELGVPVYEADTRAKVLMTEAQELMTNIRHAFGERAYVDGELNRTYLAEVVFNSADKLALLNSFVHPVVSKDFERWLKAQDTAEYVIKEAAILFESGAYRMVDSTVLVTASEALRIDRVMARDKITREQVIQRMSNQWPESRKQELADFTIDNGGMKLLIPQVLRLHHEFVLK